jgi:putative oxidoreductase
MTTISIDRSAPASSNGVSAFERALPLVGRILIAAIFLLSGASKLADPAGSMAYINSTGLPLPAVALAGAIVVEIVGGLLLIAGYRLRTVAAGLALFSIVTAVVFHHALGDQSQFINFFKNLAMAGGLLQIVAFGKTGARA